MTDDRSTNRRAQRRSTRGQGASTHARRLTEECETALGLTPVGGGVGADIEAGTGVSPKWKPGDGRCAPEPPLRTAGDPTTSKARFGTGETGADGDTATGEPRQFRARVLDAFHSIN